MQDPRHDENNHIQNYAGEEAIKKLKELAEKARICMFTTYSVMRPMPSRPMALQKVDDKGILYFFSAASSHKNLELELQPEVQLFFANTDNSEYLNIYGKASISNDRNEIEELWNPMVKTWFQGGKDDPDLTIIKVSPVSCEYWDTKHNKMVAFLKIAASMVTGKTMDDGVEGKLDIK